MFKNSYKIFSFLILVYAPFIFASKSELPLQDNKEANKSIILEEMSTIIEEKVLLTTIEATVKLHVGALTLNDGYLTGGYKIIVDTEKLPFLFRSIARSKNETGDIKLPCNQSLSNIAKKGGITLKGTGYCSEKDATRAITCEVTPKGPNTLTGRIKLIIDSGKRIMHFESEYNITTTVALKSGLNDQALASH